MNKANTISLDIGYIAKKFITNQSPEAIQNSVISSLKSGYIRAYAVPKHKKTPLEVLGALRQYETSNKDIYDQMKLCQKLYKFESILSMAIDIMEEFAITKIYIDNLEEPAKTLIDFWLKYVNIENKNVEPSLKSILRRLANALLIYGNGFPYNVWRSFNVGGKTYQLPMDVVLLNPLDIDIPEKTVTLLDKKIYFKIDDEIVQALKTLERNRTVRQKELLLALPIELQKNIIKNEGKVELDFKFVSHLKRKGQDHDIWGIPYLLKTMSVLNRLKSLENLDQDTFDGIINKIVFVKAGNPEDPRQSDVNNVANAMKNLTQMNYLVTGPHLEIAETQSNAALLDLEDRYEEVRTHLFDSLGVPVNLFSGRFTAQGDRDTIAVLSLQERLEELRDQLLIWVNNVVNQILIVNGFSDITPAITWSTLRLKDPNTLREYVTTFYDRGLISINTAQREAGYDLDAERVSRQREKDSGDNETFMIRPMPSTVRGEELLRLISDKPIIDMDNNKNKQLPKEKNKPNAKNEKEEE